MTKITTHGLRLRPLELLLLLMICLSLPGWQNANAAPNSKGTKTAAKKPQKPPIYYPPGSYEDDVLLLMPNKGAEQEEVDKAIKEVDGTVIGKLEHHGTVIYKIKTAKGKLTESEKKLSADENFGRVLRNGIIKANENGLSPVSSGTIAPPSPISPTGIFGKMDPYLAQEWHLNAVRAREAVGMLTRNGQTPSPVVIAVLDTGSQASIIDLSGGRTYPGCAVKTSASFGVLDTELEYGTGQRDVNNHGTEVATIAAANAFNGVGTAGVAPNALIYPVRVADYKGSSNDYDIACGLVHVLDMMDSKKVPIKIVNLSMGREPPDSLYNPDTVWSSITHPFFQEIYDKGGIVFASAGNSGRRNNYRTVPYLCVVSAIDNYKKRPWWSVYGSFITFTAPGANIFCSDRSGAVVHKDGTSMAAPVCAATAALIWGANPNLTNNQLLYAMKHTCNQSFFGTSGGSAYFGNGMPDCVAALKYLNAGLK